MCSQSKVHSVLGRVQSRGHTHRQGPGHIHEWRGLCVRQRWWQPDDKWQTTDRLGVGRQEGMVGTGESQRTHPRVKGADFDLGAL